MFKKSIVFVRRYAPHGAALLVLAAMAACGSAKGGDTTGSGGATTSGPTAGPGPTTGGGMYTCCLDAQHYSCPDKAAFDKCSGFDIDACLMACSPADFMCQMSCFMQAENAQHDPSDCQENPAAQCGTGSAGPSTGSGGSCVGDWNGQMCDIDADCPSDNCYQNKCYANDNGNPCDIDADCSSDNCYQNCCYSNDAGSPCDIDADCASDNCFNNVCQ